MAASSALKLKIEGMDCAACAMKIENATKALDGVDKDSVQVLFNSSKLKFDFDSEKVNLNDVENAITNLGYEVKKSQVKAI